MSNVGKILGVVFVMGSFCLSGTANANATIVSPEYFAEDPSQCQENSKRPHIIVDISGLRNEDGNVRLSLYDENADRFLEKGAKIARIDVPARKNLRICISPPKAGIYAIAVLHDTNANGRFNLMTDGGGFSNNPKILLAAPSHDKVAFSVDEKGIEIKIKIKYLSEGKKRRPR